MKLKFNKSSAIVPLREADENQGRRVIYIENVIKALKPAVETARYRFKADSDVTKGFHILPGQKFLSKIVFNLNSSSEQIEVKIIKGDNSLVTLPEGGASINVKTLMQETPDEAEVAKLTAAITAFATSVNSQILLKTLGESLNESTALLEYGPLGNLFNKIKNAASKHAAKNVDKQAKKQAEADVVDSFSRFPEMAQELLKTILEQQNLTSLKLESNSSKTSAEYSILPATSAMVSVALASTDDKKSLRVVKVINAAGVKVEISNPSLVEVLKGIGAKFNIDVAAACKAAAGGVSSASSETDEETTEAEEAEIEINGPDDEVADEVADADVASVFGNNKVSRSEFKTKYKDKESEFDGMDEAELRKRLASIDGLDSSILDAFPRDVLVAMAKNLLK